jgi:Rrf2 family protein
MKVSSRVDYALSCLVIIAREHASQKPVPVKFIAESEHLEVDYVEQLLIIMKRAGILKSVRGVKGGYLLARSPEELTTYHVLAAFEGEILELVCFRQKGRKTACIHLETCEMRNFWHGMRRVIEEYLKANSIASLLALRNREKGKE